MKYFLLFIFITLVNAELMSTEVLVKGMVVDASDGTPLSFAGIEAEPGHCFTSADADGLFSLQLEHGVRYEIKATYLGYVTGKVSVSAAELSWVKIRLRSSDYSLREVTVTASESKGLASASRIDRSAMEHLQPTSFADLLELLPGNISKTPDMGSAAVISLRETGTLGANGVASDNQDYAISSLGTLFMIDGAPVNNDADLQSEGIGSDASSPGYKRRMVNRGVDMRGISTDNIESVEIVRGIPSAEYGNLTSGFVNIQRVRHTTPFKARFKADEYSKLFSAGKGFRLSGHEHVFNVDLSYLDSKVDPRNSMENYRRLTASARAVFLWRTELLSVAWNVGCDYTRSVDDAKVDPDLNFRKIDIYKSGYNRLAFTSGLTLTMSSNPVFNSFMFNTSASYQHDRLHRRKQVAPQRASVAPVSMEPGVHEGRYLLGEYIADYLCDGRPVNIFVKMRASGTRTWPSEVRHNYKVGGEWTFSGNYGRGQVYDLERPLSASWTTRPRRYSDIPALQVLSFFAEEQMNAHVGANSLNLQAGLRTVQLPALSRRFAMSGRVYFDPRVNAKWTFPGISAGGSVLKFSLAGGWGMTTKMPTIDYLYPQKAYNDFIQLNYYDVNAPEERSAISLMTYIDDATNYALKPARNRKWEVRLGLDWGGNHLSVTYFRENMTDGFRYSTVYAPYSYRRYYASAIDPSALTARPSLQSLPYTDRTVLDGFRRATNGTRIVKQGVEFQLGTARWQPLRTALTVSGAWFRSTYSNSQMLFETVSDVVGDEPVSERYVGLYDYLDGRVNEQFNTNFMFDTQIPQWGLVFTATLQCMWYVKTTRLPQNGVPVYYLDAADGQLHPFTAASEQDTRLQFLVKNFNADNYRTVRVPFAGYLNFKATKRIGRYLKLAMFVNRIMDWLPDYKSNGLVVRRASDSYFGMEATISI